MARDQKSTTDEGDEEPFWRFVDALARDAARYEFRRRLKQIEKDSERGNDSNTPQQPRRK